MRISDWSSDVCSSDLKWRPASMRLVPGALLGVVAGTLTALVLDMNVARVEVPDSILAAITPPTAFASWLTPEIIAAAIAVAFIASAETLLSAAAVDKMHDGPRSDFNKELRAQGRSEEHTSELQSLMRISYAVFCLKKK